MVQQLYAVRRKPSLAKAILLAGLIAGTLDALFAIAAFTIATNSNPVIIFWYIASGMFHNEPAIKDMLTADAGTQTMYAIAGLLLHYFIAYAFITLLFIGYPTIKKVLANNPVIALLYGIFVWLVMNYIVLPIAMNAKMPVYTFKTILGVLYLVIAIGIVGVVSASKYYKRKIR